MDCQNCQKDYYCCKKFHVTLSRDEAKNFKYKRLRKLYDKGKFLGYVHTLTCQEDGFCNYFDKISNKCKIYENRPEVCKNWNECENING